MAFEKGCTGGTRFAIATEQIVLVRPIRPQPRVVLDGGWMLQQRFDGALLLRTSVCRARLQLSRCRLVLVEREGKDMKGPSRAPCPYSGTPCHEFQRPWLSVLDSPGEALK
jgi:hypothetical protein